MLPVDLFNPVYRIIRKRVVDGYAGDVSPTQMVDHVVNRLELFLQVVGFAHIALRISCFGLSWFLRQTTAIGRRVILKHCDWVDCPFISKTMAYTHNIQ